METPDYYSDRKFCSHCNQYMPYLMSIDKSYCAECGNEVRLFSKEDWSSFHQQMEERRPRAVARASSRRRRPPERSRAGSLRVRARAGRRRCAASFARSSSPRAR
jgi:hypothetical protein